MSPTVALVLSSVVFFLGFIFVILEIGKEDLGKKGLRRILIGIACVVIGIVALFVIVSNSTVRALQSNNLEVVLDKQGRVIDVPQRIRWALSPLKHMAIAREVQVKESTSLITKLPKVQRLELTVTTEIADASRFVESMGITPDSQCKNDEDWGLACLQRDFAQSLLRGFLVDHLSDLSKLGNPNDPSEPRTLESLLHANLDEPLASKGLRLAKFTWTME